MNEEEREILKKRAEALAAAPIGLAALMNLLIDKGVITREELLDYIKSRVNNE